MIHPLLEFRIRKGLSREALAAKLGVNQSTVWRWETGDAEIPIERLAPIRKVTGIPAKALRPELYGGAT